MKYLLVPKNKYRGAYLKQQLNDDDHISAIREEVSIFEISSNGFVREVLDGECREIVLTEGRTGQVKHN